MIIINCKRKQWWKVISASNKVPIQPMQTEVFLVKNQDKESAVVKLCLSFNEENGNAHTNMNFFSFFFPLRIMEEAARVRITCVRNSQKNLQRLEARTSS